MIVMEIRKERHCHYSSCPKKSSIFCGQAECVHPNASVNAKAEQLCKYGVRNTRNSKGLQHFSVKIFLWDTNTKNSRKWFKMNSYIRQILNNHRKICTSIIAKGRPPTPPVSALASFENADSESADTQKCSHGENGFYWYISPDWHHLPCWVLQALKQKGSECLSGVRHRTAQRLDAIPLTKQSGLQAIPSWFAWFDSAEI